MSKPDIRAIVDLRIDFIVQNVSATTMQCHFTDGWGASKSDPAGHEGSQDCLLDRYQLCAQAMWQKFPGGPHWFDYTACLFRNQKETDTFTDDMRKFNATVQYCSEVTGFPHRTLESCAEGERGVALLAASHAREQTQNPFVDKSGHHHPNWIIVDGKDYGQNSTANWLELVCDAYTASSKLKSCTDSADPKVV